MPSSRHFRQRVDGDEQRTTSLELFFDLVFVFAITQISHVVATHLNWQGVGQSVFLLLAVWWAWNYTTWMTNWFDPDALAVRVVLIAVMLLSLLMSVAIPHAFGDLAWLFAAAYVGLQVLRNSFNVWSAPSGTVQHKSFLRILCWSLWTGALWLLGPTIGGDWLIPIWLIALSADYLGPYASYYTPGLGRTSTWSWNIEGSHFAERFQLFVLISLGESIVVTGITAARLPLTPQVVASITVAFLTTAAMWWLYFNFVASRAQQRLATASNPGQLARDAFTYLHLPIVLGIIAMAVADELLIAHPDEPFAVPAIAVAGPVLYLIGHNLFRLRMVGSYSTNRLGATIALLAVIPIAITATALVTSTIVLAVLVVLIVREARLPLPPPLQPE